jgi:hypothetical protein
MLYTPGANPETTRAIENVLSRSSTELTADGFQFFVSPDDEPMPLTLGSVYRTPEQSNLTLIVNGSIDPDTRQKIANVVVAGESYLDNGRYWFAKATEEVVAWDTPTSFSENIMAINLMFQTLTAQRRRFREHADLDREAKWRLDLEAKSSIGWLAMYRGISDEAVEAQEHLLALGLKVPHSKTSDLELRGKLQTKNGAVSGSFKAMTERDDRHTCACCSGQIIKNSTRMTLGLDRNDGYSDHHHYHVPCFDVVVLPRFDVATVQEAPAKLS